MDTVRSDTLCDDPGPNFRSDGYDPSATCRKTKKFILRWERPEDTLGFRGYRLYLDTNPRTKSWKATQGDDLEASVVINETGKVKDGLVFFFYDRNKPPDGIRASARPDTFKAGEKRIFGLDTNDRLEVDLNRFVFALATRYKGSQTQGQPQYTIIITGDKFPPNPFNPAILPGDRKLSVAWSRPNDPTSFFDPTHDTGIIAGYWLTVKLSGKQTPDRSARFKPSLRYWRGGVEKTGKLLDTILSNPEGPYEHRYFLPDSSRARRGARTLADSLKVVVDSLTPLEKLDIVLFAVDSAGNSNDGSVPDASGVILTDTTQPTTPEMRVIDSLTGKNSFVVRWTASRDRVDKGNNGKLEPGDTPNFGIAGYRLTRILQRPPGEPADPFDRKDTLIEVDDANIRDSILTDTVRFLPPGKTYQLLLTAVDTTGYPSATDTASVTTDSILFSGADSGLTCPPGMVPIPAATFRLGESGNSLSPDESPSRALRMASFCIEPYEHRDSTGDFAVRLTWQQADSACQAISPEDSTMLCSEAEWERACEGFDRDLPHPHGIQSERNPAILQISCNQATGDSVMAMSFELRNPICLTNEGVYDMAGNLSEWVRDPYNAKAYAGLQDSSVVGHGFAFPSAGSGDTQTVHSLRGGNFLKPNLPAAQAQALARCSNRDFPMQVRPLFRPDCVGDRRQIAVTYAEGLAGFRCYDLPDSLANVAYSDIVMDTKDSTRVLLFRSGVSRSDMVRFTPDSAFRGKKPIDVRLTTLALARVIFEKVGGSPTDTLWDYLDVKEMRDSSQTALKRILDRESPSEAWKPRMEGGRYDIRKYHAHTLIGSRLARPYFASRNVGFRCCGKPRAKAAPAMVAEKD